ncbi:hypothetical protein K503DRAFT_774095 [Rhizopogon vinicolor AM-OR11-026]|uniref:Uncharacterized protein n=1 Tax=Rhizopogon vinicolor AM-OR11-026 TaxID=1314800 RepID=A0A1B7MQK3_9AGAM|nr:hypothetical protein K503DRAFT_774095 [Rhizopogon vinicolor AM-OR11-026]
MERFTYLVPYARIQDIGPITRYSSGTSDKIKITAHIQDGSTIEDIDIVLFGTGYYPYAPYLQITPSLAYSRL